MDDKYIVFKSADRDTLYTGVGTETVYYQKDALNDAVVIRTQDVFASAGLSAYAHNIRTQVSLIRSALLPDLTDRELDGCDDMCSRLTEIARYFEAMAQEAEDRISLGECKVPD